MRCDRRSATPPAWKGAAFPKKTWKFRFLLTNSLPEKTGKPLSGGPPLHWFNPVKQLPMIRPWPPRHNNSSKKNPLPAHALAQNSVSDILKRHRLTVISTDNLRSQ
jgi:hypothetical protein